MQYAPAVFTLSSLSCRTWCERSRISDDRTRYLKLLGDSISDESINAHLRRNRAKAAEWGVVVVTNRPFGMGALLYRKKSLTKESIFNFQRPFDGIILTGTKSPDHLRESWAAFHARSDRTI